MGKNNRSRRAAKARKRQQEEARRRSPRQRRSATEGRDGLSSDLGALLAGMVLAHGSGDASARDQMLQRLLNHAPIEVAGALTEQLESPLLELWDRGWQPADLMRLADKELTRDPAATLRCAIASEAAGYEQWGWAVAPEWMAQLQEMEAKRWWEPSRPWPLQTGASLESSLIAGAELLTFLRSLPSIPVLAPPPSEWSELTRAPRKDAGHLEPGLLAKIRALLAKAESTEFDAEAESFTAKAQELMTRHRIDRAGLAAEARSLGRDAVARRVGVENPYTRAKAMLVGGIARANSCRAVWSKELCFTTIFGHPEDVEGVEELYTSLLVQATSALQREGSKVDRSGRSRTARFRRSFLLGFAVRIAERLQETTDQTVRRMEQETGRELVPVLDNRERAAEEAMNAVHYNLRGTSATVSDGEGYRAGTRLADVADLGPGPKKLAGAPHRSG